MGSNSKPRVVLQFNEMDFRHRRALDILRQRPRSMSELVVNAILHYTSCPEAANEFGRSLEFSTCDWVVSIVKDVVREMVASGELQAVSQPTSPKSESPTLAADDLADLGGVMGMFRSKE